MTATLTYMKFTRTSRVALFAAATLPFITHAQTISTIPNLFLTVISWINGIFVPLIFAIAFVAFLIGIYYYFIQNAGNAEKTKEGRSFLMWSLIGFFIMFSVWGLINLFLGTLGFNYSTQPGIPQFNNTTSNGSVPVGSNGLPSNGIFGANGAPGSVCSASGPSCSGGSSCNTTVDQCLCPSGTGVSSDGSTCVANSSINNSAPAMTTCANGVSVPVGQACPTGEIMCGGDPAPAGSSCCAGGGYAQAGSMCPNGTVSFDPQPVTLSNGQQGIITACTPSDPSCPPGTSCNFSTGACDTN